jgi:hypothetical protein
MPLLVFAGHSRNVSKQQQAHQKKLCTPQWRTKRAEILKRDNSRCVVCSAKENLHVHHLAYTGQPWEAPNDDLVTLCSTCHKKEHRLQATLSEGHGGFYGLGRFFIWSQFAMERVGKETPHAAGTLLRLLARVERENQLYFHSVEFANQLGIPRTTLENHFNQLRELGVVVPDPKQETRNRGIVLWRLCPFLVWVGTADALRAYLKTLRKDHPFFSFQEPAQDRDED